MARQLDLVQRDGLRVKAAASQTEPRLWVRRMVLWSEPGVVLRDISLRPGLNIVWSPDPSDRGEASEVVGSLGHGSGKTLFCRLLRYCLGEDRFAPDAQRDSIAVTFKDGLVGIEVVVDGSTWAVVRSLGIGRRHAAAADVDLHALAQGTVDASSGVAAFRKTVEVRIISESVAALIAGQHKVEAWPVALAWLTRDQECRFDDVLDWRSAASDSLSPVRGFSSIKTLDALRALLGAIDPAEHVLRAEISKLEHERDEVHTEAGHREWEAKQMRSRIIGVVGLEAWQVPPGPLAIEVLNSSARHRLAEVARVDVTTDVTDIEKLRTGYENARRGVEDIVKELAEVEARLPEIERILSAIRGELPALSFSAHESAHPICPICEVPIDHALVEGCKLSHKLPDWDEARKRWEQRKRDLDEESERLQEHRRRQQQLLPELAAARHQADNLRIRLQSLERARDSHQDAWYSAQLVLSDVARLAELYHSHENALARVQGVNTEIERKRQEAASLRDAHARIFQRVSELFDAIVRELVGPLAEGGVHLDGHGLHLNIEMGGDRSTAAIDSLKVLAFDLAALCMSIEGATHVPAFLVHDSPREADLGLSVYHRLFRLAHSLEEIGSMPLFQYIVTTTTRPPDDLRVEPWLRLTLEGAPAEKRLLKADLR